MLTNPLDGPCFDCGGTGVGCDVCKPDIIPGSASVASRMDLIEEVRHWKERALKAEAQLEIAHHNERVRWESARKAFGEHIGQ